MRGSIEEIVWGHCGCARDVHGNFPRFRLLVRRLASREHFSQNEIWFVRFNFNSRKNIYGSCNLSKLEIIGSLW